MVIMVIKAFIVVYVIAMIIAKQLWFMYVHVRLISIDLHRMNLAASNL
jgi:hypothetical protein